MIGDYPTQLDEIDQWLNDNFGIVPGACSSTENLRYSVARRVAEALWPNNQSLSDANKRLEEIAQKGLENAHTVDFSKQYENSMKILQKAKINLPSDVNLEEEIKRYGKEEMPVVLESDLNDIARHFAEWGAEWQKEKDTRDMYMSDNRHYEKVYELGKKDMKEQMGEQARKELAKTDLTLADLVAFDEGCKIGRRLERQDMLKDTVKGTVCKDKKCVWIELIPNALPDYEDIEPVKCVVMKED